MPRPLDPAKRAAILADIQAGELGRNEIARKHRVGAGTVTKIAQDEGMTDAFDRSETEDATRARRVDLAAQRAEVSALFLRRAREALEQFDKPHVVFNIGGKDNTYTEHTLDRPTTGDMRNLATVAGIAVQRHLEIERADSSDVNDGVSMLGQVAAGLTAAYQHLIGGGDGDSSPEAAD